MDMKQAPNVSVKKVDIKNLENNDKVAKKHLNMGRI